jgi:hypothetical protein
LNSKSVLYISYDFPPILSPESIQSSRTAKYLSLRGWKLFVLTSDEKAFFEIIDSELMKLVPDGVEILRSKPFRLDLFAKTLHIYHALLGDPDRKRWWAERALRLGLNVALQKKADLMYSHSTPLSCHLLALEIKEMTGLPWIAHFSDPWVDSPYFRYRDPFRKAVNQRQERLVFDHADAIIFTTEETQKIYKKKYPEKQAYFIPHSYDPDILGSISDGPEGCKVQFVHTGNIYGIRTPVPLFQGLKYFIERHTEARNFVEFLFFGRFDPRFKPFIEQFGLNDVIKIKESVPYLESLRILKKATVLLLIEAPDELQSIFLPSKLVDYIGLGKPIFAITPNKGPTARVIQKAGFFLADPRYPQEIGNALEKIWETYLEGEFKKIDSQIQTEYKADAVVVELEKVFKELLGG